MNDMSNPTSWQKASLIGAELQSAEQTSAGVPTSVGMLSIKSANRTLTEASMTANPKQLYGEFWFEHEIGCLFADSNVGKSILAIQIAEDIAKTGEIVLYFDFELSEKQFQLRFTDEQGNLHHFPSTLYRVQPDMNLIASIDEPFEDALMRNIENVAVETKARILIIDNISILCMQMEKGEDSAALVQRLRTLKNKYGFSILIIAHTPKRNMSMPITQNDLVRNCEMRYGGDNVMVCHIEKVGTMVQFINMGTAPEHDHLRMVNREEQVQEVRLLSASGLSLRDIASRMGVSKSTVNRMLREVSGVPDGQTGQVGQTGQDGLSQVSQPSHLSNGTAGGNAITCKTNDDGTA